MKSPKLSVLMSIYNSEEYLCESMDSILEQDFKDFEFLIIDDGSMDKTSEILDSYQKRDSRVRIIKNRENIGLSRSLNIGIKQARGEYIARQDADDISMPGRLKEQVDFMESHADISLAGTSYIMVDKDGKALHNFKLPSSNLEIKNWLKKVNCFCHGSVIFRKKDVERCGFYPEQYVYSQDYALWLEMSRHFRFFNMPSFLYKLRLHKNARSIRDKARQWECAFKIKKDKALIAAGSSFSNHFISDEFFRYGIFFNNMGMKIMALKYFMKGISYRSFIFSTSLKKDRPLGICMVTGEFYPDISGGGLQCRTLAKALKKYNFKLFILTTTKDKNIPLDERFSSLEMNRIYVGDMSFLSRSKASLILISFFLNNRNNIDIIHLHGFSQKTILILILSKIFGKKVVQKMTSLGDDDPASISKKSFGRIRLFFFLLADLFISVSPEMTRRSIAFGLSEGKVITIPNGVDTERFRPSKDLSEKLAIRRELGLPENSTIVMYVGFFSKDKGADILLEAYKLIKQDRNMNVLLLFIGATNKDYFEIKPGFIKKFQDNIKTSGIKDKVISIEKTLEIEKYYRASDIFALPSLREGLPNVLLEAMSTALPCILSDLEGIKDYLISNEIDGLIFEKGNPMELSQGLARLLYEKDLSIKLGNNARSKIIERFSIEQIAEKYYNIYNSQGERT